MSKTSQWFYEENLKEEEKMQHKLELERLGDLGQRLERAFEKQLSRYGKARVSWEGETAIVDSPKNYHIISGFEGVETLIPEQEDENYDDKLKAQDHLDEIKTIEKINK
tara:strand:+ start:1873 stop:2199 length:327 start_codon:yes stop_codon:yes gene_type:complete